MKVRIYLEGGARGAAKGNCRKAFRSFFGKVIARESFELIASGDRYTAYKHFCLALKRHPEDYIVLLVDSEAAVTASPWQHLATRAEDKWPRPSGAHDDQVHLMVQVMESWFLADRETLAEYYDKGFLASSLPGQSNVEMISKQDVLKALQHSSKKTQKGPYHKTKHGFDLLELIEPTRVRAASNHADRLLSMLEKITAV